MSGAKPKPQGIDFFLDPARLVPARVPGKTPGAPASPFPEASTDGVLYSMWSEEGRTREVEKLRKSVRGYLPVRLDRDALMFDLEPALPMIAFHSLLFRAGALASSPRLGVGGVDPKKYDKEARRIMLDVMEKAKALEEALFKPGRFPYASLLVFRGVADVRFDDYPAGFSIRALHQGLPALRERASRIAAAAVGPNPGKPEVRAITASVQTALEKYQLPERIFFRPVMRAILGTARVGERATARVSNTTKPHRKT